MRWRSGEGGRTETVLLPGRGWTEVIAATVLALTLALPGCGAPPPADMGANQSLVAIGEAAMERGAAMEEEGETADANIAYRRALWAFRYHERLTGEEPLLLGEAQDGLERTTAKRRE